MPRWGTDPAEFDPNLVRMLVRGLARVFGPRRSFEVTIDGWENVPESPVMLVSNHSGGSTTADAWGLLYGWHRHFRVQRAVHVLAHEFLLATRLTGPFLARCGVLRASRGRALDVLSHWKRDLLVMPGGDRDVWRPWHDRFRVQFGGHRGYARIALAAGVPIVPVAHAGAHETLMVLTDGVELAKRLKLHELARIDVFPIHLSLPWGLCLGPLPHVPVPAHLRYRIGPPVPLPPGYERGSEPTTEHVENYDIMVRDAMQSLLDQLRAPPRR